MLEYFTAALSEGDATGHGEYELRYGTVDTGAKPHHIIEAHHPDDGRVGYMQWMGAAPHAIHWMEVSPEHQRKGLASAMWNWAQDNARPKPKHSRQRTDKGDAWARSVGGPLPRRQSSATRELFPSNLGNTLDTDISEYFGGSHEGRSAGRHVGGRGKPRRDGGREQAAPRAGGGSAAPGGERGEADDPGRAAPGPRSVEFHPQVAKDLRGLEKPVQKQILGVVDDLAAGAPNLQTHALTLKLHGWYATKASRGHRIVHRTTDDGGIHVGYIGLHDYDKAIRRLTKLSREPGPVSFPYVRNTEDAPYFAGAYAQDVEPHGRYLSYHDGPKPEGDRWETGLHFPQGTPFYPHGESEPEYRDEDMPERWSEAITAGHFRVRDRHEDEDGVTHVHLEHKATFNPHTKGWESSVSNPMKNRKQGVSARSDDDLKPLPERLYHVTTAVTPALEHGLKTRQELGQQYGHGLGGGRSDTISLTSDRASAEHLLHSLHEYHDVLNGKTTLAELKDKARQGAGAKQPYDYMLEGLSDQRVKEIDSGRVTEPKFHILGEHPEGWEPKDEGVEGNGKRAHMLWDRPLSHEEKIRHRSDAYKQFAWGRQASGGHPDPLFIQNDPVEFAKKDPGEFSMLHVRAKPGAHGIQMNDRTTGTDAGEWRALSGKDLDIVRNDDREAIDPRTAAHPLPTSRVFGPTYGLDHRLFTGEQLKPEVRTAVMSRLGPVLEPLLGQSWEAYTKVYLAGSEASEWTSETLEGNGDFDTLIGIDYGHARDMHAPLADLDDSDITDLVNTALRTSYNASPWVAPFGGTFDLTGYCNAGSYDIRRLKPYAAYNISDDQWSVRPPHLPDWSIDRLPEGGDNLLAEAEGYAAVVDAISKMPEPFQTQQGKALWKHLHSDRGRAFSDEGEGWLDPGNLIEKALVEWGVWDKLVEWQYGTQKTAVKSGALDLPQQQHDAFETSGRSQPVHSDVLTDDGRAWMEKNAMLEYFTAMPAKNYPPPGDFSHEIHDLDPTDNDHAKQDEDWPGWNHKILYGKIGGQHAGHIVFSENPDTQALSVGKMETYGRHRGQGVASAMQDALVGEHPDHWINHGSRTGPGRTWWNSYDDPAPDRNIHNIPHEHWEDAFHVPGGHDDPRAKFGEDERPTPRGGKEFGDVQGEDAYIGGAVRWQGPHGQEDHDLVHDKGNFDHDARADTLLSAAQQQGSLHHGQFHDDFYSAQEHSHELAEKARAGHDGPVTTFVMHKTPDDQYDDIHVQSHQPGEHLLDGRKTRLEDQEDNYHPIHDKIRRGATRLMEYFGMAA